MVFSSDTLHIKTESFTHIHWRIAGEGVVQQSGLHIIMSLGYGLPVDNTPYTYGKYSRV